MKFSRIIAALVLLFVVASGLLTLSLLRREERSSIRNLVHKGNSLVNIISHYPLMDVPDHRKDVFLKTLAEYAAIEGLTYFFVHDPAGNARISLVPSALASQIPNDIQSKSLYALGLTSQTFSLAGMSQTFYEFAKPIYANGEKTGTIRLGFKRDPIPIFSLDRMSQLAMIALVILSTATLLYYGLSFAIRPLSQLTHRLNRECRALPPAAGPPTFCGRITPVILDLEHTMLEAGVRLKSMETDRMALVSQLGATTYEKQQVLRILDSINTGIIITDFQDSITLANEYILNLMRLKREDVLDHRLPEVLASDDLTDFLARQDALSGTNGSHHVDTAFPGLAPGEIYRLRVSLIADAEETPVGKMIFVENVTKEKRTQDAQQQFTAHAAHELLTPLTNIKSYSEMLMDGEIQDAEIQKEFYNTINEQTDRLTDLIKNLLNLSKMEMGNLAIKKELVRSDWLFEDCIAATEGAAQSKGISMVRDTPHIFPTLIGDKELLKAAVINLLGNAVKYTPENGKVTFSIVEEDQSVQLDIIDTGYGIAETDLPHVFDKFYRADNPDIAGQMGTGLGLAITQEIIHLHEGDIEVKSEIGKGSHFTVRLPKEEYRLDTP